MAIRKLFYGDLHMPYCDKPAVKCLMKAMRIFKPHDTIFMGDGYDATNWGTWRKKIIRKEHRLVADEIEPLNEHLDEVQEYTLNKFIYILGNHDNRPAAWCANNGDVGRDVYEFLRPENMLGKGRNRFEMIPYGDPGEKDCYYNVTKDLVAVHGWSFCKEAASKHLELSRTKSILFAHTHRVQMSYTRDLWSSIPIQARSVGCMCDLIPFWQTDGRPNGWIHSFIIGYFGKRSYTLYDIPIVNGHCVLPDGTQI